MKPVIVIPTYNERDNIESLLKEIFSLDIPGLEIVIVDDNSPDQTAAVVKDLQENFPIYLVSRQKKMGIGSAYIKGFKKALAVGADVVFEMDADGSHDPKDIYRFLNEIIAHDIVIGSRKIKGGKIVGWNFLRKAMSAGAMWFVRIILGLRTKDVTAGFRCFRREVLLQIDLDAIRSNGYAFQEELLYKTEKGGWKVKEIPVTFVDRSRGKSKLGKWDILEFFSAMVRLRFRP